MPVDENLSPTTPAGARLSVRLLRNDGRCRRGAAPRPGPARRGSPGRGADLPLPDGRRLALLTSAAPLYDAKGRNVSAVGAFVDITLQKMLQRELDLRRREAEEASVRKTRFLAAVSHDIRTPVNAINLMAEVIRRYAGDAVAAPADPRPGP